MTQWVKWVWTTSPCAKAECSSEYLSPSTRDSGKKKKTGPRGPRASQSNQHRERQDSERPCLEKRNEILSDGDPSHQLLYTRREWMLWQHHEGRQLWSSFARAAEVNNVAFDFPTVGFLTVRTGYLGHLTVYQPRVSKNTRKRKRRDGIERFQAPGCWIEI